MTPEDVQAIVESQLADTSDTTDVRSALVTPFVQEFVLNDTYEQMSVPVKSVVSYWVVAVGQFYSVFYDPDTREFGLADVLIDSKIPHTVGVRGDLVSTFRAM